MADALKASVPSLYDADLYAWAQDQAARLRAHAASEIDWEHVAEEIESVGEAQCVEIENRLATLPLHLLKWQFQPLAREGRWASSIIEQRLRIAKRLHRNPSLEPYPGEVLDEEYAIARLKVADQAGIAEDAIPIACPYTISEVLDRGFLPDADT